MRKDKMSAYYKIRRSIQGSRNELHLQTCSIMLGIFIMRFKDERMKELLKNEIDHKRSQILANRYTKVLM